MRSVLASWGRVASSGHVFTRWSWLATAPFALTVLGGYDSATTAHERAVGLAIALAVHTVLGVVGLAAAAAERRAPTPAGRAATVAVAVLLIGVLRPMLMAAGARWCSVVLFESPFWARIATNVVAVTVALAVVARVTVTVQARQVAAARLRTVLDALDTQRQQDARSADELTAELLVSTRAAIRDALPDAQAGRDDPVRAAAALRTFSEQVVRPLSHRLFDDTQAPDVPDEAPPAPRAPTRTDAPGDGTLLGLVTAAPAGWTAAVYAGLWVPYTLTHLTPGLGARLVASTFLLATAGNLLVAAAARRVPARWRVVVLVLGYVVVADVLLTAATATLVPTGNAAALLLTGVVAYPAFTLAVALGQAGLRRLDAVERTLAAAVAESRSLSLAEHNRLLLARHRVARLLHSDVQAQCVQAALALQRTAGTAPDDGPTWAQALAGVVTLLDDPTPGSAPDGRTTAPVADQLDDLLAAWRHALDLTLQAADEVWPVLDADPARAELVLDAVCEGLTNAARHAAAPQATIRLCTAANWAGRVTVEVSSPGVLVRSDGSGYGLDELRARALDVTLSQVNDLVRLSVTVP